MSPALANHLLQSTIVAVAAGLLTLFLRNNHARTRYWIWLTASIKFLIPFSIFVELGHRLTVSSVPAISHPQLALVVDEIAQPFTPNAAPIHIATSPPILPAIWISGSALLLIFWLIRWFRVSAMLRTPGTQLEPGVFGIFRPILYLPAGIADHLNEAQLKAIVAHEHCHLRNRDNLTAALHSLVEAIFWFHPLTWWIGARLIEERERACDEEVVMRGSDPEVYAESILKICKLYLESPLTCVPGITGSDLKKRIEAIMTNRALRSLNPAKKFALAVACLTALAVPILVGIAHAQPQIPLVGASPKPVSTDAAPVAPAAPSPRNIPVASPKTAPPAAPPRQEFETASVKPLSITPMEAMQSGRIGWRIDDALVDLQSVTLLEVMMEAYKVPQNQIMNAPAWINSAVFDIRGKLPEGSSKEKVPAMLQSLLADRFGLTVHHQSEIRPVYELVAGKKLNLKPSDVPNPDDQDKCKTANGHRFCSAMTMGELAGLLSVLGMRDAMMSASGIEQDWLIDRPVVDMTGLSGAFDFSLDYGRIATGGSGGRSGNGLLAPLIRLRDSIDALGLKLDPAKRPFDVIVIDHIERTPTEN